MDIKRELPFYKFNPSKYLSGDITMCSLAAQGLFTNIQCFYWMNGCRMTLTALKLRFSQAQATLNELMEHGIIKVADGSDEVVIKFLKRQRDEFDDKHEILSNAGRIGGSKNKGRLKPGLIPAKGRLKPPRSILEEDKEEDSKVEILLVKCKDVLQLSTKISTTLWQRNRKELTDMYKGFVKMHSNNGKSKSEVIEDAHNAIITDCAGYEKMMNWISNHASRIHELPEQISIKQYLTIRDMFPDKKKVTDRITEMQNWKPLLTKNTSAFLTLKKWLEKNGKE